MSVSQGLAIIFAVLTLIGAYRMHSYSRTIQDLKTELVITQGDLQMVQAQLDAALKAEKERRQAQEEIDRVAQERSQLIDKLPSGWGDRPLPDECVRVFQYAPGTAAGSHSAPGTSDAAD